MAGTAASHNNAAASSIKGGAAGNGQPLLVTDRSMTAQTNDGLKFPANAPYVMILGSPVSNNFEKVLVTARSGDTFNMQRGFEGTAARQWPVGEPFSLVQYDQAGDLFGVGPIVNGLLTLLGNAAQALAAAGTIATAGLGISRITPAASCTGVILAAGTQDGQVIIVENTHASNTATFAAAGTSHVANGVSEVIAALSASMYAWDASGSLWYSVK